MSARPLLPATPGERSAILEVNGHRIGVRVQECDGAALALYGMQVWANGVFVCGWHTGQDLSQWIVNC